MAVFSYRPFPNILKYMYQQWDLPQSGNQDSFKHILKSSAGIYESSGNHSSLEPPLEYNQDQTNDWRIVMTILIILKAMATCSFRLVLEGKISKEIPESSR